MRSIRFAIVATLAAFTAAAPNAAESLPQEETVTWYDVELIVFRNLETRSTETWPVDAGAPRVEDARPLFPPPSLETGEDSAAGDTAAARPVDAVQEQGGQVPTPYVPLDESAYRLGEVMDSLVRSSWYEPILHVAWTQPPLERDDAPYLRVTLPGTLDPEPAALAQDDNAPLLDGGSLLADNETGANGLRVGDKEAENDVTLEALPEGAAEVFADEPATGYARPLDGVVQLSVSRYLHLDLDLLYLPEDLNVAVLDDIPVATQEWTEQDRRAREERRRRIVEALARGDITLQEAEILALEPERRVFEGFRLNQYRRLRTGEIHYFDHPVFGAIVTVTPREVPVRTMGDGVRGMEGG